jgi:hypothetical protein
VVTDTSGALHSVSLNLPYDFARLKTDAAEQRAVANSLRSPLTSGQLCQRRGAMFARLRMEAQLYSIRASAARLNWKHWAAPYASSLLTGSRARARRGSGPLPRLRAPTCPRYVIGVGLLGLIQYTKLFSAVSRPPLLWCSWCGPGT